MKLSIIEQSTIVMAIIATILFCDIGLTAVFGQIEEDQAEICNFKNVCQIVNIDDYMTKAKSDQLWNNFNNDLDTYSKIQALDEECRDTYHAFCFGQAWISLGEYLN